uniref:Uncharacterized protein n=1 Tax=Candidatus Kentrum sp. LPFa TaxID=2126335 RepID=A0A450W758_9GAMM|nr:MAG: hypothetical protein BECKLPF1236B_GA0070989_104119 [Candidatus Kentron sp. LPFa]
MAQFPNTEADILTLAERIAKGLAENTALYPAPPVSGAHIEAVRNAFLAAREAETSARSAWEGAITARQETIQALVEGMKDTLSYAEKAVDFDDVKLRRIGWRGRK